jgi:protein-disulfide isomerase
MHYTLKQRRTFAFNRMTPRQQSDLQALSASARNAVLDAYIEHPDWRGSRKCIITTPPTPGSHKYPWG